LHRAYEMSKEGGDAAQEARAALRLGRNYELAKNSEAAIQVAQYLILFKIRVVCGGVRSFVERGRILEPRCSSETLDMSIEFQICCS